MTYRVEVASSAVGQLRRLDTAARLHVQAAVELLAEQPRPTRAEQIPGGNAQWRVRTGGLRLVYEIDEAVQVIRVVALGRPVRAIPRAPRLTVPPPESVPSVESAAEPGANPIAGPEPDPIPEPSAALQDVAHDDGQSGRAWFWRRSRH